MNKNSKKYKQGRKLAKLLFDIHQHIELPDDKDAIIYYEDSLVPVLKKMGLPAPIWDEDVPEIMEKMVGKEASDKYYKMRKEEAKKSKIKAKKKLKR